MMETRIFAVVKQAEGSLTLCLTPIEPDFPAPGVVAVLRMTGAINEPAHIALPGAYILPKD